MLTNWVTFDADGFFDKEDLGFDQYDIPTDAYDWSAKARIGFICYNNK